MLVEQLVGVLLVGGIVLAEYEVFESLILIHQRQGVELVLPDDVVCFLERGVGVRGDQIFKLGHEFRDRSVQLHAADAVVAAGDDADQLAVGGAVLGDCDGGMSGLILELEDILEGLVRADIGIAGDKARLVALDSGHHCSLILNRLGTINKGDAALFCQRNRHLVVRNRLHDCGNQRDIQRQGAFFLSLFEFDQWGLQADICRDALGGRIAWNQQVLAKSVGRFTKIKRHKLNSPYFIILACGLKKVVFLIIIL